MNSIGDGSSNSNRLVLSWYSGAVRQLGVNKSHYYRYYHYDSDRSKTKLGTALHLTLKNK